MKLRHIWALGILSGGVAIAACGTDDTTADDDDDGTTVTGTMTGTPGGSATGTTTGTVTGTPGGTATGTGGTGGSTVAGCYHAVECADPTTQVCDLETQDCVASECDPTAADPTAGCTGTDPYCLEQHAGSTQGACYEICDPYDVDCPGTGMDCMSVSIGQEIGVCHNVGTGTAGAACTPMPNFDESWGTNSGCLVGHMCMDDGAGTFTCVQTCDFFGSPDCAGTTVCYPGGYCDEPIGGDNDDVAVGATCTGGAPDGEMCGIAGGRDGYAGECYDLDDDLGMVCHAYCDAVGKFTCPAPMDACYDVFGPPWQGSIGMCAQPTAPADTCYGAAECPTPATQVCNVDDQECVDSECVPADPPVAGACTGTDPICLEQQPDATIGACYEQCDPYDDLCPGGGPAECVNNNYGQTWGLCLHAGTGTRGDACAPLTTTSWGTTSGCTTGNVCLSNECWQVCDFFGSPTCANDTVCLLGGYCDAALGNANDATQLGADCTGLDPEGELCGLGVKDGYAGACNDMNDGLGMICRPLCTFDDNPCATDYDGSCYDVFAAPLEGDVGTCADWS